MKIKKVKFFLKSFYFFVSLGIVASILYLGSFDDDGLMEEDYSEGNWHYAYSFSGPPERSFYRFYISGEKFKLTSTANPYQGDFSLLTIYIFSLDSNVSYELVFENINPEVRFNVDKTINYSLLGKNFILTQEEYNYLLGKPGISTDKTTEIEKLIFDAKVKRKIKNHFDRGVVIQRFLLDIPFDYNSLGKSKVETLIQVEKDDVFRKEVEDQLKAEGKSIEDETIYRKIGANNYTNFLVKSYGTETNILTSGPGNYFIVIDEYNIHNWNIQIEDYY